MRGSIKSPTGRSGHYGNGFAVSRHTGFYLHYSNDMTHPLASYTRLAQLLAAVLIGTLIVACGGVPKLAPSARSTAEGIALFDATSSAHGREAFLGIHDLSIAYDSRWYDLIQKIQPILTDGKFRQGSEERLILANGITAQTHSG